MRLLSWHHSDTVSSANLTMVLELNLATQSCVYREYNSGRKPGGDPVFRVRGLEVCLPSLMIWSLGGQEVQDRGAQGGVQNQLNQLASYELWC